MHADPSVALERLRRVVREQIRPRLYEPLADASVSAWCVDGDGEPVPAAHALGLRTPATETSSASSRSGSAA